MCVLQVIEATPRFYASSCSLPGPNPALRLWVSKIANGTIHLRRNRFGIRPPQPFNQPKLCFQSFRVLDLQNSGLSLEGLPARHPTYACRISCKSFFHNLQRGFVVSAYSIRRCCNPQGPASFLFGKHSIIPQHPFLNLQIDCSR